MSIQSVTSHPSNYVQDLAAIQLSLKTDTPSNPTKTNPETIAQQILNGISGGVGFLFDRARHFVSIPGVDLGLQFAHRGLELGAALVDVGYTTHDYLRQDDWADRSRPLSQRDIKPFMETGISRFEQLRTEIKPNFTEWIETLLSQTELAVPLVLKQLRDKGIDAESLTGKTGAEALDLIRQAFSTREHPLQQAVLNSYTRHHQTIRKTLFSPLRAVIHSKQQQLKPLFRWNFIRSLLRIGLSGPLSAILLGLQVGLVAGAILFPAAVTIGLIAGIITVAIGLTLATSYISARHFPNTFRAFLSGLTTQIFFTKIHRFCLKLSTGLSIRRLRKQTIQAGQKNLYWTQLGLNLVKELEDPTLSQEKRAAVQSMLDTIANKRAAANQRWEKSQLKWAYLQGRQDRVEAKLKSLERTYRHAKMADFMRHQQPQVPYLKTPLSGHTVSKLLKALNLPTTLPSQVRPELRDVVRLLIEHPEALQQPQAQSFLKNHVFKNKEEEISQEDLKSYLISSKDPLKLRALVKEILHQDPELQNPQTKQWVEFHMQMPLEPIRALATVKEKERALYKAIKNHLCLSGDEMRELIRTQSKIASD